MTSPSPVVTCNIMSYRYGHLVCHAIESVLSQTALPDVIRVFDDGVGDCFFVEEKYPEVELIERPKNLGIVRNFNDALKRTTTERVIFLGADNWLDPETIELCLQKTEDIVSYDAWIVGKGHYERWTLPYQAHGSAMYNVAKAKEVGGYAPSGRENSEEDSVLFNKMMEAGATFTRVDKPLLNYRRHRENFIRH